MSTQAGYIKYRWREKVPQVLWSFIVKGYATTASQKVCCESRSACQHTAVVLSVRCRTTCLSTAQRRARGGEQITLSCRRVLCRSTSGAEPPHWWTDPEYEFSVPHPKVPVMTIKSRVEADASPKYSGLSNHGTSRLLFNKEVRSWEDSWVMKPLSSKVCKDGFPSLGEGFLAMVKVSARETDELKRRLTFQKSLSLHKQKCVKQQEKMYSETLKSLKLSCFSTLSWFQAAA